MLVLTRHENESIVIDEQITIRVLRIAGNRVRIGIEAPADKPIRRDELPPGASPAKRDNERPRAA